MYMKNIKGGLKMTIGNLDNILKMNLQLLAGEVRKGMNKIQIMEVQILKLILKRNWMHY